jgi:hypothetical protein
MEWLTDRELGELDDLLRGNTDAGNCSAFLATLDGIVALCRAFPRASSELRSLRGEAQRLRQQVALTSEQTRELETELRLARAQIEGLERQVRAA